VESFFVDHAFVVLTVFSCAAPLSPVKRITQKLGYASTAKKVQQEPPAGHKLMESAPPSLHNQSTPDFAGGPQGCREREAKNDLGDASGGYTNQICLRPHPSQAVLTCRSDSPAWKRLLSKTLTAPERASLITTIFPDHNQVEIPRHLSQDDAQTFIDMIDEVILCTKERVDGL